jgi:hypothetical protein
MHNILDVWFLLLLVNESDSAPSTCKTYSDGRITNTISTLLNNLAFSNFSLVMQNYMVTKHQDLNHFHFDEMLVEADLKQTSLKAKWLFCKDVYILLQKVCVIVKLLSFRTLYTACFLKLIHVSLLVCQPLFIGTQT